MKSSPGGGFSRLKHEHALRGDPDDPKPEPRHRVIEYVLFGVLLIFAIVGALALYTSYSPKYRTVPNRVAEGISKDRVNLLFIGIGGDKHPGGGRDLADSLILISVKPSTHQVAVISIPRDLYVKIGRYGRHRINRAHAIGNQTGYPGAGPALSMNTVEGIFAQPVHAFVRLDFQAFEKIIDDLGGIEIDVKSGFYDFLFRDQFRAGKQVMNGDRALRFARYRYVDGPEGTNFAREARQRQVMEAVKAKLSRRASGDVLQLMSALRTLSRHSETNLTKSQMIWMYRNFGKIGSDQVAYKSLQPYTEIFQLETIADPGEAVRTRTGDYSGLQQLARDLFEKAVEPSAAARAVAVSADSRTPLID